MTEKIMLEKINDLLSLLDDDKKRQVFLSDFDVFLAKHHPPTFEVGEYYKYDVTIFKVLENADKYLKTLELTAGKLRSDGFYKTSPRYEESVPATAEQIAEFTRAKIKNDIDFIIKDGDGDWIEIVENIEDYFQTAEELREVSEDETI